jgi:hypothetical protein
MAKKTHGLTRNEWITIGVGAAVVGGLVYAVYKTQQSTQAAAAQVSGAAGQVGNQVTQAASPLQQLTQGNPVYNVSQGVAEQALGGNYAGAPPIGTPVPAGS